MYLLYLKNHIFDLTHHQSVELEIRSPSHEFQVRPNIEFMKVRGHKLNYYVCEFPLN